MGGKQSVSLVNAGKGSAFDLSKESNAALVPNAAEQQQAIGNTQFLMPAQSALNQQLLTQAQGGGPSIAESQLKANSSKNLAQQLAAASGSKRKTGDQLGALAALKGQQSNAESAALGAGAGKAGEVMNAQNTLGNNLGQASALQDKLIQNYTQQGFDLSTATKRAQQQAALASAGYQNAANAQNTTSQNSAIGGLISAGGSVLGSALGSPATAKYTPLASNTASPGMQQAFNDYSPDTGQLSASDKRVKKDIKDGKKPVNAFLEALSAKEFKYKHPLPDGGPVTAPAGKNIGIMAQDLEKSDVGKQMVDQLPDGTKTVNPTKGFGAVLAAQADLHQRMKKLEKRK